MSNTVKLLLSIIIPFIAAGIGALATSTSSDSWYDQLDKPSYNPPSWVFGLVWNPLYLLMGLSLFLIWRAESTVKKTRAYLTFALQLIFNTAWSIVFFQLQSPWLAAIVNIALLALIMWTIREFWKHSTLAAALLAPYLLWTIFAVILNLDIAVIN